MLHSQTSLKPILGYDVPGTLVKPGPIGRLVRLFLGLLCLWAAWGIGIRDIGGQPTANHGNMVHVAGTQGHSGVQSRPSPTPIIAERRSSGHERAVVGLIVEHQRV